MKIATPIATMGIRGTTGVVDVPQAGTAGEPKIKLYPDARWACGSDRCVRPAGRPAWHSHPGVERVCTARPGPGGRFAAVPFQIPPQEALRDRGVLQRLSASHTIGQRQTTQRRQLRERNRQRPNELRRQGGPREQQNIRGNPGGRPTREPGTPGPLRAAPRKPSPSGQKRK